MASDRDASAFVEEGGDLCPVIGGDEWTHLGGVVQRVADLDVLDGCLERGQEPIDRGALDQDARARAAVLSGVAEDGERRGGSRLVEVGVGEDDVGRLASQLQRYTLDGLRRELADPPPDLGRSGEGDLRDVWMLHQAFADHAARADDHVQHSVRKPRLVARDLRQLERGERRQPSGLQHDRVARGERRTDLP